MNDEEVEWVTTYQSYLANFIRTGNPNDWTDNPNPAPSDEIVWPDTARTGRWAQLGINEFDVYSRSNDVRMERCDMLDEINHYMLH